MRTNIYAGCSRIFLALLFCYQGLFGQNNALHFDGGNDFIALNPIANLNPSGDFSVEMWCISEATGGNGTCSGDFRRLFSFSPNRFEAGECMGVLSVFLSNIGIVQSNINVRDNQWHCVAAVRSAGLITIYYDGVPAPNLINLNGSGLSATSFYLGHWPGGLIPGQDWLGKIDEVKLWNNAQNPANCSNCVSRCDEPNLIAYWRFDEGVPNGNNTGLTSVNDCTGNNNNGNFYLDPSAIPATFALNGTTSNFVPSTAPLLYPEYTHSSVSLSDPLQTIGLTGICSGDPVHFSIFDNHGNLAQAATGTTVAWEYSDDCFATAGTPIAAGNGALFSGFSFVSPPGHPATSVLPALCSPNAYVDRCYRAIITVTDGVTTCTYTTDPTIPLRICCPIQNAQINVNPAGPLCEGDSPTFSISLSSNMPQPNPSNNVHINWCVSLAGGPWIPLTGPAYDDQISISYPSAPLSAPNICFKATISNCLCPAVTVQTCIKVDLKPVCGTIRGSANPATLMSDPDGNPDHYLICPGNHAAVEIATPFTHCIPTWQFSYPNTQPGVWHDMGSSNSNQNTGILPWSGPSVSPYAWPSGETSILYRIKCNPLTNPSGCSPCYSNEIRICLKTLPPAPVITAVPSKICKNGSALLSVQNHDPNCTYKWYDNGSYVGSGRTYTASNNACYWVTCNDGCFTVASNQACVTVCEPVAGICCPMPVCPCLGDPITLSGQEGDCSFGNCGPLTYLWSWVDATGTPQTATTSTITDVPAATGTTYTLTVTDSNGCTDTVKTTIVPCSN